MGRIPTREPKLKELTAAGSGEVATPPPATTPPVVGSPGDIIYRTTAWGQILLFQLLEFLEFAGYGKDRNEKWMAVVLFAMTKTRKRIIPVTVSQSWIHPNSSEGLRDLYVVKRVEFEP